MVLYVKSDINYAISETSIQQSNPACQCLEWEKATSEISALQS